MNRATSISLGLSLLIAVIFLPQSVSAAPDTATITVQPASLNIELSKEFPENLSMITLTNNYNQPVNLTAEFKGIDTDTGRIIPLGEPGNIITETLKLSETNFVIPASSRYFLKIAANDNTNLTAGGHYATLVIRESGDATRQSSINSVISIGVFLVKRDGAKDEIVLTKNKLSKSLFEFPKSIDLEFLNDGNVHITPRASVIIKSGETNYSESIVNQQSRVILPTKRYAETVNFKVANSPKLIPKQMSLIVTYRPEGSDSTKVFRQNFIVIPKLFWAFSIAILAINIYLIVFQRKRLKMLVHTLKRIKKLLQKN